MNCICYRYLNVNSHVSTGRVTIRFYIHVIIQPLKPTGLVQTLVLMDQSYQMTGVVEKATGQKGTGNLPDFSRAVFNQGRALHFPLECQSYLIIHVERCSFVGKQRYVQLTLHMILKSWSMKKKVRAVFYRACGAVPKFLGAGWANCQKK